MEEWSEFQVPVPNTYRRARLGRVIQRQGQVRGMRVPTTYHLLFIHTGEAFLARGARAAVRIGPGSAVLLRPQDLSHQRTIGREPSRQTWVAVVPDALSEEQLALLDASPEVQPLSAELNAVRQTIVETAWRLDAPADEAVEAVLAPLIVGALMLYVHEARRAGLLERPAPLHPAVAAACEAIRRRLDERLALRELAAAGHVTPEHLIRLFRQELGTTPARYLWEQRVRAGIHLLEHSTVPIAEVAERTGFQTPSHFVRHVRAAVGLRPRDLRRVYRQRDAAAMTDSVLRSA
jgi:AraC family transcriptional regulator of arabinose operon